LYKKGILELELELRDVRKRPLIVEKRGKNGPQSKKREGSLKARADVRKKTRRGGY